MKYLVKPEIGHTLSFPLRPDLRTKCSSLWMQAPAPTHRGLDHTARIDAAPHVPSCAHLFSACDLRSGLQFHGASQPHPPEENYPRRRLHSHSLSASSQHICEICLVACLCSSCLYYFGRVCFVLFLRRHSSSATRTTDSVR